MHSGPSFARTKGCDPIHDSIIHRGGRGRGWLADALSQHLLHLEWDRCRRLISRGRQSQRSRRDCVRECVERLVAGDEVRLRVELDQRDTVARRGWAHADHTLVRPSTRLLLRSRHAALPKPARGCVEVASLRLKCLLALVDRRAGALTQLLHEVCAHLAGEPADEAQPERMGRAAHEQHTYGGHVDSVAIVARFLPLT